MKGSLYMTCGAIVVAFSVYVVSYFLCVSQVRFGFTGSKEVSIAPAYRYVPYWFDAVKIYEPLHSLDRNYLRVSVWQDRPAREAELSGTIVGPRRVLFSIPITNAP